MVLPFVRYFEFGGRSSRMEFWLFTLFTLSVMTALFFTGGGAALLAEDAPDVVFEEFALSISFWILLAFALFALIPNLSVSVRRFHDAGFSGWVFIGLGIVSMMPYIGLIGDLGFLIIALLPSAPTNQWGENPNDGWERDNNYGYDRPEPAAPRRGYGAR